MSSKALQLRGQTSLGRELVILKVVLNTADAHGGPLGINALE